MARGFVFRFSSEGYDEIRRQLEALGPLGKKALADINQGSPALRDNMRAAGESMDVVKRKLEAVSAEAVRARAALTQAAVNDSFGIGSSAGQRGPDYAQFWNTALVEQDRAIATAAGKSQRLVNELLGVRHFAPLAQEVQGDYEAFWAAALARQDRVTVEAAGRSQKTFNALLGVQHFAPLSREVEADYVATWERLLAEQDAVAERAAATSGQIAESHRAAATATVVSAGQMSEARRIVTSNLINMANVAVATRGDIASMASPIPDVVYGLRLMGGSFGAVTTGVLALAAPVAAVVAAQQSYLASTRAVAAANQAMGGVVGLTAERFDALAKATAETAGISVAAAREQEAAYVRAGAAGGETMGKLIALSRDYAAATGQDLQAVVKDLSDTFADPVKGAEKLTASMNLLNGQQLAYVRSLQASGQTEQARLYLADALNNRVKGMGDNVSVLASAWERVSKAASDAFQAMGKATAPESNADAIKRLEAELERVRKAPPGSPQSLVGTAGEADARAAYFGGRGGDARGDWAQGRGRNPADIERELELRRMNEDELRRAVLRNAEGVARGKASVEGDAVARSVRPLNTDIETLTGNITKLEKGLGSGLSGAGAQGGQALEALRNQLADYTKVAATGLDLQTYKQQELAAVERKYASVVGPQRDELLAKERARIELIGTATTTAERRSAVESAVTGVVSGQTQAVAQQNAQLSLQARGALQVADAWLKSGADAARADAMQQASLEALTTRIDPATRAQQILAEQAAKVAESGGQQAYQLGLQADAAARVADASVKGTEAQHAAEMQEKVRNATLAETTALEYAQGEAKDRLRKVIEAKTAAVLKEDEAQRKAAAGAILQQQRDQLELGRAELELMGASAERRSRTIALLQAEQQIRNAHIDSLSAEAQQIRDNAVALADQQLALERSQAAYQELERFGEKAFDAILDKMVQTGKQTVSWSDALKAVGAELQTLAWRMALINPAKNLLFGTNLPTVWDMPVFGGGGAANQNGAAGSAGGYGSLYSSAAQWAGGKVVGYGMDKLGIQSPFQSVMDYQLWGSAAVPAATYSAGYVPIGGMSAGGYVYAPSAAVQAQQIAQLQAANAGTAGSVVGADGAAATAGATVGGFLGTAGAGFGAGYLVGGYLGTRTNSYAVGIGSGALSGAGAGALAGTYIFPGIGTAVGAIIGAVVGALGGRLGTQKIKTPYGGAWVNSDSTGQIFDAASGAENGVNASDLEKQVRAINSAVSGLAQLGGFTYGQINLATEYSAGPKGKGPQTHIGGWDGAVVSTSDSPAKVALDVMKYLRDSAMLNDGDPLAKRALDKAIATSDGTNIEEVMKAVALAKSVTDSTSALTQFDKSLQGFADRARKTQTDALKPMLDELKLAGQYDFRPEYVSMVSRQITDMVDNLANPRTFTQTETAMAEFRGQIAALRDAAVQADPALGAIIDRLGNAGIARIAANLNRSLDQQLAEALGHGFINQINAALEAEQLNARDLTAVGLPITRAQELRAAQLDQILRGLTADQLDFVTASYGATSDIGKLAQTIKALGAVAGDVTVTEQKITQIRIDNANETIKALQEQQNAATQLKSQWEGVARSASQARLGFLTDKDLTTYDPRGRLDEAMRQYQDALAKAQGGDATAAGDVQNLARVVLDAARTLYGPTQDYARIFTSVQDGLSGVESAASRQISLAAGQLATLQQQLATQQNILTALNKPAQQDISAVLGALNSGNLADLVQWGRRMGPDVLQQVLYTADTRLGWQNNPYRYGSPGDVQSIANHMTTDDFLSVGRTIGFAGGIAELNPWIVARDKQSDFESAVRAWGAAHGYENGGIVGNGLWGRDSVLAMYANGGPIKLAGGEGVLTARATAAIGPDTVNFINRNLSLPANDRWTGGNIVDYRRPPPSGGSSEVVAAVNRLCDKVDALIRVTAASGDGAADGLAEVASGVQAVARKLAAGEVRS